MEEMTNEEKAKAYDEALKYAMIYYKDGNEDMKTMMKTCFPILVEESKDERICGKLIAFLKQCKVVYGDGFKQFGLDIDDAIAWLEKKGEQKSIWHNEDEEPQRGSLILLVMQSGTPIVAKIIEPNHTFNHGERWAYIDDLLEKQGEQKPAKVPKFKVGDRISFKHYKKNRLKIITVGDKGYYCEDGTFLHFDNQYLWELVEEQEPRYPSFEESQGECHPFQDIALNR